MARRGFFAEVQHQAKVAQRQSEQRQRAAARESAAAARKREQAASAAARARTQAARASESERKRADAEAKRLHIEEKEAEVGELNSLLAEVYDDIDGLLAATLGVDDFVDLEALRQVAVHPPFDRMDLEQPTPPPPPVLRPSEPAFSPPPAPSGLKGVFGKSKHAEAVAAAQAAHQQALAAWQAELAAIPGREAQGQKEWQAREQQRLGWVASERARYDGECAAREQAAAEANAKLDELIAGLNYGTGEAVNEYIGIVLSNSVYPPSFPIEHEYRYDPDSGELALRVLVPGPDDVPGVKAYKYTKASDEITSTELGQKLRKDRYNGAVHQTALRTLHEIFEADRRGQVRSVSLELGTPTTDPATGQPVYVPFVAAATTREAFAGLQLDAVVPTATLTHLGATVSKNPHDLVGIDPSGIRRG
jgi:restriction system protein